MTPQAKTKLLSFLENGQIDLAIGFVKALETTSGNRTQSQHNALWLWFSMIEHEAENAGITWNQVVGHTHQLRITKEGLHVMCKQLQKALWGTTSTKDLKKVGQIEILVQHFADLFSKVGLELPPFPCDEDKQNLSGQRIGAINNLSESNYPEYKKPLI
jgi:hypothetical protein